MDNPLKKSKIVLCLENMQMQRVSAKAIVRSHLDTCSEYPDLTSREMELLNYALRFCPVPDVIARIDATSKRDLLKELNDEMN